MIEVQTTQSQKDRNQVQVKRNLLHFRKSMVRHIQTSSDPKSLNY